MVKLSFLGAMNYVGSSGVLVDTGGKKFVFDYGTNIQDFPPTFPFAVRGKIEAIFLSHAHLDHSGGLPILMKKNSCPIYAAPPSKQMVRMLLKDSLKIARNEGISLPFNRNDADKAVKKFKFMRYKKPYTFGNTKAFAYDAGHIPGSMMTYLKFKGNGKYNSVLYTGDFNTNDTQLQKGADTMLPDIDILITESTYADREHGDREEQEKELVKTIHNTLANDGIALVSNFAIGRTQEILLILDKYGIDYPLYMDGMSKKATTIINGYPRSIREPTSLDKALRNVEYITSQRKRKKAIRNPCVILTTSGMLSGGPIVWYLQQLHSNPANSLSLTGYQVEETPGRILMETGKFVFVDRKDKSHTLDMKMSYRKFDFSSHLGSEDLLHFIKDVNPEKVFCVHGDNTVGFAERLKKEGFDATAPLPENRVFKMK